MRYLEVSQKILSKALLCQHSICSILGKNWQKQVQETLTHTLLSACHWIQVLILKPDVFKDCKDSSTSALPENHWWRGSAEFPFTAIFFLSYQLSSLPPFFLSIKEKEKHKMLGLLSFLLINQATKICLSLYLLTRKTFTGCILNRHCNSVFFSIGLFLEKQSWHKGLCFPATMKWKQVLRTSLFIVSLQIFFPILDYMVCRQCCLNGL